MTQDNPWSNHKLGRAALIQVADKADPYLRQAITEVMSQEKATHGIAKMGIQYTLEVLATTNSPYMTDGRKRIKKRYEQLNRNHRHDTEPTRTKKEHDHRY